MKSHSNLMKLADVHRGPRGLATGCPAYPDTIYDGGPSAGKQGVGNGTSSQQLRKRR
jgi:hypothetical protein